MRNRIQQTLLLMVGIPDYKNYVTHVEKHHPGETVMSYEEFFRNRQDRRYGGRASRCC